MQTDRTHPHFDEEILVWSDAYSGRYAPPPAGYYDQFEEKWQLVLSQQHEMEGSNGLGFRTDDEAIARLVFDWTGTWPADARPPAVLPKRSLSERVDPGLIRGRRCLDAGCGSGRWTRVMQRLGASEVLSVDASEASLKSTARYNGNVLEADLSRLPEEHPELVESFDFANLWGVAHHTHDPRQTFHSVASAVKPGGAMFIMLYDVGGMHNQALTNHYRRTFHRMTRPEERLDFIDALIRRRWHPAVPLWENLKNVYRKLRGREPVYNMVTALDVMVPSYSWTVPVDVAIGWMREAGFETITVMNPGVVAAERHYLATGKRSS